MLKLNCPELYHIAELYRQGYGSTLIGDMIDRDVTYLDHMLAGHYVTHRRIIGRISNGKRPAKVLRRSWEIQR